MKIVHSKSKEEDSDIQMNSTLHLIRNSHTKRTLYLHHMFKARHPLHKRSLILYNHLVYLEITVAAKGIIKLESNHKTTDT
jgi:hypothetical protein